jgi:2-amino-4-hydroxy-6-hydroxymethyldihydropteridine diphosphokinase
MMARVFLGLGSNLGNRLLSLRSAVSGVANLPGTRVLRASSIYETEPYGEKEQPDFLNAVIEIETTLPAENLHRMLKEIEHEAGRIKRTKWGPREIDIDILFFGTQQIRTAALTLPHPGVEQRRFVLEPLAELSREFTDPETNMTVSEMLQRCTDRSSVRKYPEELILTEET